eukprot:CAMPEP_0179276528 /NCGR_PEP_ID=MMETSP0797-20121207/34626_1 /TAXON_ID=47934 /ORGANISM="Dinophysis acuminata, Strain DAEP01" /LENGTH=249 /DNA_ID=CAMNT_0020985091 /DNA_START=74 /DNA_END=820 /DNA_ORIENTATION=+
MMGHVRAMPGYCTTTEDGMRGARSDLHGQGHLPAAPEALGPRAAPVGDVLGEREHPADLALADDLAEAAAQAPLEVPAQRPELPHPSVVEAAARLGHLDVPPPRELQQQLRLRPPRGGRVPRVHDVGLGGGPLAAPRPLLLQAAARALRGGSPGGLRLLALGGGHRLLRRALGLAGSGRAEAPHARTAQPSGERRVQLRDAGPRGGVERVAALRDPPEAPGEPILARPAHLRQLPPLRELEDAAARHQG